MLDELGEDHRSWLLVAAHNFLCQQQADRAMVLLELLELLDPHNTQCQKMLAYAHWLQDDSGRCAAAIERVLGQQPDDEDRAAMEFLRRSVGGHNAPTPPRGAILNPQQLIQRAGSA